MKEEAITSESWLQVSLDRSARGNLVKQIVDEFERQIHAKVIKAGDKLPSVRCLSKHWQVSTFTIVEAYERLISAGWVVSRRGSGYFVVNEPARFDRSVASPTARESCLPSEGLAVDRYRADPRLLPAGAGWLPVSWHADGLIQEATRRALRVHPDRVQGYGHPLGLHELRQLLVQRSRRQLFEVCENNVILTRSATHAFDLILSALTKPGDKVLVENPGYLNLPALIRQHSCTPIGVDRTSAGLDLEQLSALATEHRPKLAFINTVLQNPLGTTLSTSQSHRLLGLADEHDFGLLRTMFFATLGSRMTRRFQQWTVCAV